MKKKYSTRPQAILKTAIVLSLGAFGFPAQGVLQRPGLFLGLGLVGKFKPQGLLDG